MTITADIPSATVRAARAFIAKVAAPYDFSGALLFGSRTHHTNRPDSDADFAVLLLDTVNKERTCDRLHASSMPTELR